MSGDLSENDGCQGRPRCFSDYEPSSHRNYFDSAANFYGYNRENRIRNPKEYPFYSHEVGHHYEYASPLFDRQDQGIILVSREHSECIRKPCCNASAGHLMHDNRAMNDTFQKNRSVQITDHWQCGLDSPKIRPHSPKRIFSPRSRSQRKLALLFENGHKRTCKYNGLSGNEFPVDTTPENYSPLRIHKRNSVDSTFWRGSVDCHRHLEEGLQIAISPEFTNFSGHSQCQCGDFCCTPKSINAKEAEDLNEIRVQTCNECGLIDSIHKPQSGGRRHFGARALDKRETIVSSCCKELCESPHFASEHDEYLNFSPRGQLLPIPSNPLEIVDCKSSAHCMHFEDSENKIETCSHHSNMQWPAGNGKYNMHMKSYFRSKDFPNLALSSSYRGAIDSPSVQRILHEHCNRPYAHRKTHSCDNSFPHHRHVKQASEFSVSNHSQLNEGSYISDESRSVRLIRWSRGKSIGRGTYGEVFLALDRDNGQQFAVKRIANSNNDMHLATQLQTEINVLRNLRHENIVQYVGSQSDEDGSLLIFLEFVTGGNLAHLISEHGILDTSLIKKFSSHIVHGVAYLHRKGIVHRDIKSANVLLTDSGVAKLADFGCSRQLALLDTQDLQNTLRSMRGSIPWMAPEMIKQTGHSFPADVWSVGCTILEMATGQNPWPELKNQVNAMWVIAKTQTPPPGVERFESSDTIMHDLLIRCLAVDPNKRDTAESLKHHQFLS